VNFKSYQGTRTIGPFHKSFTAVVGPNGSGKSNVFDALLFVFGKRASKIRLKKLSELIHNSTIAKDIKFCSVSVYFHSIIDKEDEAYDVVPNSEFVVTRTATDQSVSKYFINQKSSSFTEVTTLLKEKGIDLENNRFLILQGEVEQISLMKPKSTNENTNGLLEYLEDIIGTFKYVEMIEEKFKEVEKLNELRGEKLNRVKLVEKDRDGLEGAKDEAELYMGRKHLLQLKQAELYQYFEHQAHQFAEQVMEKRKELQHKLEHERRKLEETTRELEKYEEVYNKKKNEYETVENEMNETKKDWQSYERKDIKLKENMKHENEKIKKLKIKQKKLEETIEELEQKLEVDAKSLPKLEKKTEKINRN